MKNDRWDQLVQMMVGGGVLALAGFTTYLSSDALGFNGQPGLGGLVGVLGVALGVVVAVLGVAFAFVPSIKRPLRPGVIAALLIVGVLSAAAGDAVSLVVGVWLVFMGLTLLLVPWLLRTTEPEDPGT